MMNLKQDNERLQRMVTSKSLTSSQSSLPLNEVERRFSMGDAIANGMNVFKHLRQSSVVHTAFIHIIFIVCEHRINKTKLCVHSKLCIEYYSSRLTSNIKNWLTAYKLVLNKTKTNQVLFSRRTLQCHVMEEEIKKFDMSGHIPKLPKSHTKIK